MVSRSIGSKIDPKEVIPAQEMLERIDDENIKANFLYVINSDKELLEFYNSSKLQQEQQMKLDASKVTSRQLNQVNDILMNRGFFSTLGDLNRQLAAIGTPVALRYAFVASGAGIMGAVVDGPIPVGDIVAIIVAVGAGAIIWCYWDFISENSEKIIEVLKNVFYQVAGYIENYYYSTISKIDVYMTYNPNPNLSKEEEAVDRAGNDNNKIKHIMDPKHDWNKFFKDPKWKDVAPILLEVLRIGKEEPDKDGKFMKTIVYLGEKVVVTYNKVIINGIEYIRIGTAYVEKY